jgi:hypothetical protein
MSSSIIKPGDGAGLDVVSREEETTRAIQEGDMLPVLGIIAMPPEARFATYQQIKATIEDPRNASKILHGLTIMAHRQLTGLTPIPPMLLAACLAATKYRPAPQS